MFRNVSSRIVSVACIIAMSLTAAACGDNASHSVSNSRAATNAGLASGLGPTRFSALVNIYVAAQPLDALARAGVVFTRTAYASAADAEIGAL